MADFVTNEGQKITFDFSDISIGEFRSLRDPYRPSEEEDAVLAKASGLTPEEINGLNFLEFRRFVKAFYTAAYSADPEKN